MKHYIRLGLIVASHFLMPLAQAQAVKVHEGNVVSPLGTAALPPISAKGDSNTGFYYPGADIVGITAGGVERFRVGISGNGIRLGEVFESNTSANFGGGALNTWSNSSTESSTLDLNKSRSATIGTHTIVQSGDQLGGINWRGSNGTSFDNAALIQAFVDATPGASSDMPGRLTFSTTPDASSSPLEHMRIGNAGLMTYTVPTTSGTNVRTSLADGQLMFANNNDSSVSPAISGRGVSGRNGLVVTAFVDPASGAPDQQYQVLSSTASALSTGGLTNKAYIWYADGTEIASIKRNGGLTVNETTGGQGNVPHICATVTGSVCNGATGCDASCPSGAIIMGGGCSTSTVVNLAQSYPLTSTSWRCSTTSATNLTPYAICCKY